MQAHWNQSFVSAFTRHALIKHALPRLSGGAFFGARAGTDWVAAPAERAGLRNPTKGATCQIALANDNILTYRLTGRRASGFPTAGPRDATRIENSMEEEAPIGEAVTLLFAFASPNRYRILKRLCEQEMNVSALWHELDIRQSTLSRELSLLRMHGFITQRREQARRYYSCNHEGVKKLMKTLDEVLPEVARDISTD